MAVKSKPTPKVAKGKSGKPAAKGKVKAKAKAKAAAIAVGTVVSFVGYAEETKDEEKVFEPGQVLVVKEVNGEGADTMYVAVRHEDSEKYDADPNDESIVGA